MTLQPSSRRDIPEDDDAGDGGASATPEHRAFIRSAWYEFDGVKLQPYSALRENAAFEMGFRGGMFGDADMLEMETTATVQVMEPQTNGDGSPMLDGEGKPVLLPAFEEIGGEKVAKTERRSIRVEIYKQFPRDVQIVLWLCHQSDATCFKAIRKPDAALLEAMKWAERKRVRWGMAKFEEAAKVFSEIMEDRNASAAEPEPEAAGSKGSEPGN